MQRITIFAMQGNTRVSTAGVTSQTLVEGSFPGCTVSVFTTGTTNLATIYGDNLNPPTPKSNPFTADSTGSGFFYAANGSRVDIQLSGTGISVPFVLAGDVLVDDFSLTTISPPVTVTFSATPQFDLSQADWYQITLTGNVTGPTFPNANSGAVLFLTITQDGTGGRTWAWPASFLRPPAIALAANAVTELVFKFDGTNWRSTAASGDNTSVPSQLLVSTGSAGLPSLSLASSQTTGWFRQAADVIGVTIAGVLRWLMNSAGILFGSGQAIGYSSNADPSQAAGDTWLSRISAGVIGIGTAIGNALGSLNLANLTATGTINKVTITQPASSAVLTIANSKTLTANSSLTLAGTDAKTLTINNSLTLAGTDATTMTFPASSDTVVTLGASQTLTGKTLTSAVANGTLNGSAIHAQHIGSLSISAAGSSQGQQFNTTQTISQNMGDTNFRCVVSISGVSAGSPFVIGAVPASATSVTITFANGSAVQSTVTAIDLICVHD